METGTNDQSDLFSPDPPNMRDDERPMIPPQTDNPKEGRIGERLVRRPRKIFKAIAKKFSGI